MRTRPLPPGSDTRPLPGRHSRPAADQECTVALLAAEAFSLVTRACSTRAAMRRLAELAGDKPQLLASAARRCADVGALDRRVREHAARLLRRTASQLRRSARQSRRDEPGGPA